MTAALERLVASLEIPSPAKFTPKSDLAAFLYSKYPILKITSKKQYESSLDLFDGLGEKLEILNSKDRKIVSSYLSQLGESIEEYESEEFSGLYDGMTFANLVDELLEARNLKRKNLEDIFGDKTQVSRYLNKGLDMKMGHLLRLAKLLKCEVSFLAVAYSSDNEA